MRISPLLLFALLLLNDKLHGQYIPLVEESKYWIYYDFQARARPTTGFLITIKGDTIVKNTGYKKVYKYQINGQIKNLAINEPEQFVADIPYKIGEKELVSLLREDTIERKIYNLPIKRDSCNVPSSGIVNFCNDIIFCDTSEHLLFDFSLMPGDTLNYCCFAPLNYNWQIIPRKIDSINLEMQFGKARKTFYTFGVANYLPNFFSPGPIPESQVIIIEGVGFKNQGIFNYRYGNLVFFCEGGLNMCDIISSTKDSKFRDIKVKIHPNPASGYIIFESLEKILEVSLFNSNLVELKRSLNDNVMDISALSNGVYFVKSKLDNGNVIFNKIVVFN